MDAFRYRNLLELVDEVAVEVADRPVRVVEIGATTGKLFALLERRLVVEYTGVQRDRRLVGVARMRHGDHPNFRMLHRSLVEDRLYRELGRPDIVIVVETYGRLRESEAWRMIERVASLEPRLVIFVGNHAHRRRVEWRSANAQLRRSMKIREVRRSPFQWVPNPLAFSVIVVAAPSAESQVTIVDAIPSTGRNPVSRLVQVQESSRLTLHLLTRAGYSALIVLTKPFTITLRLTRFIAPQLFRAAFWILATTWSWTTRTIRQGAKSSLDAARTLFIGSAGWATRTARRLAKSSLASVRAVVLGSTGRTTRAASAFAKSSLGAARKTTTASLLVWGRIGRASRRSAGGFARATLAAIDSFRRMAGRARTGFARTLGSAVHASTRLLLVGREALQSLHHQARTLRGILLANLRRAMVESSKAYGSAARLAGRIWEDSKHVAGAGWSEWATRRRGSMLTAGPTIHVSQPPDLDLGIATRIRSAARRAARNSWTRSQTSVNEAFPEKLLGSQPGESPAVPSAIARSAVPVLPEPLAKVDRGTQRTEQSREPSGWPFDIALEPISEP